jgi:hypothetical protein
MIVAYLHIVSQFEHVVSRNHFPSLGSNQRMSFPLNQHHRVQGQVFFPGTDRDRSGVDLVDLVDRFSGIQIYIRTLKDKSLFSGSF